jgi:hypothetical protein
MRLRTGRIPNRFFYLAPDGVIPIEEVPSYAGLVVVNDGRLVKLKDAPVLHKEPLNQGQVNSLCRACGYRYWAARCEKNQ